MSDFQRDFLRAKLARLPSMPPPLPPLQDFSIAEDDEYDHEVTDEFLDSSSVSSASSTSTIRAPYQLSSLSHDTLSPPPGIHFPTHKYCVHALQLMLSQEAQSSQYVHSPTMASSLFAAPPSPIPQLPHHYIFHISNPPNLRRPPFHYPPRSRVFRPILCLPRF